MTTIIPGLYGLDSGTAWRVLTKDPQKYIDRFAKDPAVRKEMDYFSKKIGTFETLDDLMKDRRAFQFLLDSYGLGSEINNAGRLKKVLTEDPTDPNALVNKLAENKFREMALSLRFDQGLDKLQRLSFIYTIEEKYIVNEFEEALGEQDVALRQAAYFARNVNNISDVYSVLGDRILRDVVTATFNLPPQLAIQPIESQASAISSRVDITKFAAAAQNARVTAGQLQRAQSDYALIEKNLAVSDAALSPLKDIQSRIAQLATDYANLDIITDPMGANAADIAVQETAIPEIVRFEQLIDAGSDGIESVGSYIRTMQDLIAQAKDPSADLNSLKAQFDVYAGLVNNAINNASATVPSGASENILTNGANDSLSVTIDANGTQITMNRYDLTSLQNSIATAQASFQSVSGSGDIANLSAAEGRLLLAEDDRVVIADQISTDKAALDSAAEQTLFAATLNSAELLQGRQSIDDANTRLDRIDEILDSIRDLATESRNRTTGADRSDLEAEFDAYRTELRDLIENGGAGLDNFLNNIGDQNYEIINGQSVLVRSGIDLATTIADVLDGASLSDPSSALDLQTTAILLTNETGDARDQLNENKPALDSLVERYDPRARLDSQIYALQASVQELIGSADVDGLNLLSSEQSDIRIDSLTSGMGLRFRAQTTFENDYTQALNDLVGQLGNGSAAILNALDDLDYVVTRSANQLSSDNRAATMEYGKLGATIDLLSPQETNTSIDDMYKTNTFTEKFLVRYLTLNSQAGSGVSGPNSYVLSLFGGGTSGGAGGSMESIMNLAFSLKA